MAKNCVRCGKKLSLIGNVETKDGYICKQCAKAYKEALNDKSIAFANKTLEELDTSVSEAKKSNKKVLIIVMAAFLIFGVGLMALGGILEKNGSGNSAETTEPTAVTEETTAEATTEATTTTPPTSQPSIDLSSVHDTTHTEHNESDGRPTFHITAKVEDTEENKKIFLSDAKLLLADYLGTTEETAGELIDEAVAGEVAEYGSTGISFSDHLGGNTYEIFVCDDWRFW